ncbi:hypothetical protein NEUTE1DRAFT_141271 [Neurospora tetrasperma FGSC 2508]|uniref:Uncharacterized protein n=1 Tax=Neurospora tetrasperma (strain FGSC 2508 / ATCC MYA-4615 / P0657) TaxID=510951 RepID=F8MXY7_NEUT8|nr:uncharacterized protein NEUTE1DRAFT_141271 [Neurospora tetrasperma FGSC 2508]EGO53836.1 hypothetical protein NEUTE1DRAFT_141271 [Neurospora tetrasperma FGSC 2508]
MDLDGLPALRFWGGKLEIARNIKKLDVRNWQESQTLAEGQLLIVIDSALNLLAPVPLPGLTDAAKAR